MSAARRIGSIPLWRFLDVTIRPVMLRWTTICDIAHLAVDCGRRSSEQEKPAGACYASTPPQDQWLSPRNTGATWRFGFRSWEWKIQNGKSVIDDQEPGQTVVDKFQMVVLWTGSKSGK
jgi:hypothetical protein